MYRGSQSAQAPGPGRPQGGEYLRPRTHRGRSDRWFEACLGPLCCRVLVMDLGHMFGFDDLAW